MVGLPKLWLRLEIERKVLLVEALLAELEELHLAGEVFPDDLLGRLGHGGLVDVAVHLAVHPHLICGGKGGNNFVAMYPSLL